MAVYLFTFHAYRSWNADKPQGYVTKGGGVLPPDKERAEQYNRNAKHPPITFDAAAQRVLVDAVRETSNANGWRLHQINATTTHIHILVSWGGFFEWAEVSRTLKRKLGAALSSTLDRPGPWFSRGGSRKRVNDRKHFDHLMNRYLPGHRGASWRESDP